MNLLPLVKSWYKQTPSMVCKPGCTECCQNYVPSMTKDEWLLIKHPDKYSSGTLIETCPFLGESGCEIYPCRPLFCRIYATVAKSEISEKDLLKIAPAYCSQGCQPEHPLLLKDFLKINAAYEGLLWNQLCRVTQAFLLWRRGGGIKEGEPWPDKFQWLRYVFSTRDGQHGLRMIMGELDPDEIQTVGKRLAEVINA